MMYFNYLYFLAMVFAQSIINSTKDEYFSEREVTLLFPKN